MESMRSTWTDERLDDLADRMDLALSASTTTSGTYGARSGICASI
jgi:hypothetical protein